MNCETLNMMKERIAEAHAQKLAAACTFIMVPMPGMFGMGGLAVRGLSFALWGVANG